MIEYPSSAYEQYIKIMDTNGPVVWKGIQENTDQQRNHVGGHDHQYTHGTKWTQVERQALDDALAALDSFSVVQ